MEFKFFTCIISLILINLLSEAAAQAKCERQGLMCSANCTRVLACMGPNFAPMARSCPAGQLCRDDGNGKAVCDSEVKSCSSQPSVKVLCGIKGELPHPTDCASSVLCTEIGVSKRQKEPIESCTCPDGTYADITRPSFPCRSGECPREPVTCDTRYKNGKLPGTEEYCYFCLDTDEILVYICNGETTRRIFPDVRSAKQKVCKATRM